jgi:hypothetical protein
LHKFIDAHFVGTAIAAVRLSKGVFKHCGAAMESHVITDGGRANFYFAETLCSITAFCRLYAGKTPHFNIPQERRAPAE